MSNAKPKIAVMLDENTSEGGMSYKIAKNYFNAIEHAGGIPYGIPYVNHFTTNAVKEFDAFFSTGGGVALPAEWYEEGQKPLYPFSERTPIEIAIMKSFLDADKPVFGSCNGMQALAGINGCKMRSDLGDSHRKNHDVKLVPSTKLHHLIGKNEIAVNSRHGEAVAHISDNVIVSAISMDGIIEAIEIPDKKFALGLQWHQEDFWKEDHSGNFVFTAFIKAACEH